MATKIVEDLLKNEKQTWPLIQKGFAAFTNLQDLC